MYSIYILLTIIRTDPLLVKQNSKKISMRRRSLLCRRGRRAIVNRKSKIVNGKFSMTHISLKQAREQNKDRTTLNLTLRDAIDLLDQRGTPAQASRLLLCWRIGNLSQKSAGRNPCDQDHIHYRILTPRKQS